MRDEFQTYSPLLGGYSSGGKCAIDTYSLLSGGYLLIGLLGGYLLIGLIHLP